MEPASHAVWRVAAFGLVLLALSFSALAWIADQRQVPRARGLTIPVTPLRALSLVLSPTGPGERPAGLYPNFFTRDLLRRVTGLRLSLWVHDRGTRSNQRLVSLTLPTWPLRPAAAGLAVTAGWLYIRTWPRTARRR
jgi:hypothetical protein